MSKCAPMPLDVVRLCMYVRHKISDLYTVIGLGTLVVT